MFIVRITLLLSLLATACIGPQPARPHVFSTTTPPDDAVDHAVRVLSQHGLTIDRVDERARVVQTQWQGTAFMYGSNEAGQTRYVTRRFTVTIAAEAAGSQVFVRVEDMACANPDAFIAGDATFADCQVVDGVVPPDQALLDRIGQDLAGALGVPPAVAQQQQP
jgi:hypothetical protein